MSLPTVGQKVRVHIQRGWVLGRFLRGSYVGVVEAVRVHSAENVRADVRIRTGLVTGCDAFGLVAA